MNNKEKTLHDIIDIVVECCQTEVDGDVSLTKEDVLGKSRKENVVMTRCILAMTIVGAGFSRDTAAMVMRKSVRDVGHLVSKGYDYLKTSKAFRVANAEVTLRCRNLEA